MNLYLEQKFSTYLLAKLVSLSEIMVLRKPEVVHDVLPEKFDNFLTCDVGKRHCFHQLSELVRGNQHESELRLRTGKRTYYIKPSLHEEPKTSQSMEVLVGSV